MLPLDRIMVASLGEFVFGSLSIIVNDDVVRGVMPRYSMCTYSTNNIDGNNLSVLFRFRVLDQRSTKPMADCKLSPSL